MRPWCASGRSRPTTSTRGWVPGGYAEYIPVPQENLLRKPPYLSFEEAAAMPLVFLTAWNMLVSNARLRFGEDGLIWGAGSGVRGGGGYDGEHAVEAGAGAGAGCGRRHRLPGAERAGGGAPRHRAPRGGRRAGPRGGGPLGGEHPGAGHGGPR